MTITVKPVQLAKVETDFLILFARSGKTPPETILFADGKEVDRLLSGDLSAVLREEKFEGAAGDTFRFDARGRLPASRICVAGLGEGKPAAADLKKAVAASVRRAAGAGRTSIAISVDGVLCDELGAQNVGTAIAEAAILGSYRFLVHKGEKERAKHTPVSEVQVLTPAGRLNSVAVGCERGRLVGEATVFARDLVNESPSVTTPAYLADVARDFAKAKKSISCEILGPAEMKKLGMHALLAIARGSGEEPRFIKLSYHGGGRKTVCLVGKGITFDTGGLSLKSSSSMETMKLDMAGAAAILGLFRVIADLKVKVNVVGLICATENMPGSRAVKPGDVVRAMSGKTIEILNTDAEGRVVLADGLSYAVQKVKPDVIVDLATLTGACMVALGEDMAGLFANDRPLGQQLLKSAEATGEALWELPLFRGYKRQIKSEVADVKNISGSRYGGAINGALFLSEFVPEQIPWAHLDIAGPAFAEKENSLSPVGGTGFGVSLLSDYLLSF